LSLVALLLGMALYFLFRDMNNLVLFKWLPKPEFFGAALVPLRPSVLAGFLRYHLPDILWFASGILLLRFIWFYEAKTQAVYIVCFYGIALVLEISQLSEKIPGTFDLLDLLFMAITAFVEVLLYKFFTAGKAQGEIYES